MTIEIIQYILITIGALLLVSLMFWALSEGLLYIFITCLISLIVIISIINEEIKLSTNKEITTQQEKLNITNHGVLNITINENNVPNKVECVIIDNKYYCEQK